MSGFREWLVEGQKKKENLNGFLWILSWAFCGVIHRKFKTSRYQALKKCLSYICLRRVVKKKAILSMVYVPQK